MIGSEMCGKKYIGCDISEVHVKESNDIINYMEYHNSSVSVKDVLQSDDSSYDCLFTCPPYSDKENWNGDDDIDMTCDEWIDVSAFTSTYCGLCAYIGSDSVYHQFHQFDRRHRRTCVGLMYGGIVVLHLGVLHIWSLHVCIAVGSIAWHGSTIFLLQCVW